jgi:hypothetical protein
MIRDLFGKEVKKGMRIILKNVEALPFEIQEIGEPVMQPAPVPGGALAVRSIMVALVIPINVVGDQSSINGFVFEGPEKKSPLIQ